MKKMFVGESCWEETLNSNLPPKLTFASTTPITSFFQSLTRKHLNQIHITLLCLVAQPQGSKTKYHWGNKKSKSQGATSWRSCVNLCNEKWNTTCKPHKSMLAHDKINEQREGWGSMGHDELKDVGCLMPMKKETYYEHKAHLLKNYLIL